MLSQSPASRAAAARASVSGTFPVRPAALLPVTNGETEGHAVGIAGEKELGKDHQLRAVFGRLPDQAQGLFQPGGGIEENRRGLYHGHAADGLEIAHGLYSF